MSETDVLSGISSTKLEIYCSFSGPIFTLLGDYNGFPDNKNVAPFPETISIDSFK